MPQELAAILHNVGSLIVVFNSARLVRYGEELEPFQGATSEAGPSGAGQRPGPAAQLQPKLA